MSQKLTLQKKIICVVSHLKSKLLFLDILSWSSQHPLKHQNNSNLFFSFSDVPSAGVVNGAYISDKINAKVNQDDDFDIPTEVFLLKL